jgi:hypothetical protein
MRSLVLLGGIVGIAAGVGAIAMQGCSSTSCDDASTCTPSSVDGSADGRARDGSTSGDASNSDAPSDDVTDESDGGDATGEGGDDGDASDGGEDADSAACVPGAAPSENGCISDVGSVFVATVAKGGNDTSGAGTMAKPYATVSHALGVLGTATAIYVCGGAYSDQITVTGAVNLYGGLTCADKVWEYSGKGTSVPVVTGTSPSFTLEVNALTAVVHVDDMAFQAPDASASSAGESSIAVWVNASTHVAFQRVTMTSGAGSEGAPGGAGGNWEDASAPTGASAMGPSGGLGQMCPCGSLTGGGGSAGATPGPGTNGAPAIDGGTGGDGLGGVYNAVKLQCATGDNGATAPPQGGGLGEDAGGTLSASGWSGGTGGIGSAGGEGQGGGGGSGGLSAAASGGGSAGGCGGCGGGPGGGGGAGGSSFALASVASNVTLNACTLTSGGGGKGGTGGTGQVGQPGGLSGDESKPGCPGGSGGTGGQAGGGGGGAGGYSVAIAYTGTKPTTQNGTTATPGTGGGAGLKGTGGTPAPTPGSVGIAQATLGF